METNPKRKDAKETAKVLKKKSGSKASSRLEEEVDFERAKKDSNSVRISEEEEEEKEEEEEEEEKEDGEGKVNLKNPGKEKQNTTEKAESLTKTTKRSTPPKSTLQDKGIVKTNKLKYSENYRKEKTPEKEKKEAGHGLWSIIVYSTILIAAVLGAILAPIVIPEELKAYIVSESYEENAKFNYVKIFDNKLKEMKTHFPNQTTRFWKILQTRGLGHLNDKRPKQPLVILMGAPPSAHNIIDCLAWKLAKALDPGNYDLGHIDGTRFSSYGGHEAKKIMDEKLEKLFQKGDRSALILHLELLPPPSPILFYSYCDNDNAPFKHAGIIFTVHLPEEPNLSLSPAEQEGMIEKYLSDVAWSKDPYEHDSVSALLSRIADTVALVNGETKEVVQSHCS